ncbi:unnamed protein product, partial [Rotaria sordida]
MYFFKRCAAVRVDDDDGKYEYVHFRVAFIEPFFFHDHYVKQMEEHNINSAKW